MTRRALGYIARTGPGTEQDRWEENEGINPFTLAVCIAALVGGAAFLDDPAKAWRLRWPTSGTPTSSAGPASGDTRARAAPGVARLLRPHRAAARVVGPRRSGPVLPIRNRAGDAGLPRREQVGTEFLQLVRFGLRERRRSADRRQRQGRRRRAEGRHAVRPRLAPL